ncbi:MAG: RHS repeat-associated core domain-containing protein [Fusobacteriaceae bacterium]
MSNVITSLIAIPKTAYNGQVIEPVSKLYFLGNGVRIYSSKFRQFYSIDKKNVFEGGSFNRYQYARLDPINLYDISGYNSENVTNKIMENSSEMEAAKKIEEDYFTIWTTNTTSVVGIIVGAASFIFAVVSAIGSQGASLPYLLAIIGGVLSLSSVILHTIASYTDSLLARSVLKILGYILELTALLFLGSGAFISKFATKTGSLSARLVARFSARTVGRAADRLTAYAPKVFKDVATSPIKSFKGGGLSPMRNFKDIGASPIRDISYFSVRNSKNSLFGTPLCKSRENLLSRASNFGEFSGNINPIQRSSSLGSINSSRSFHSTAASVDSYGSLYGSTVSVL